jgi:hypothetical protein
MNWTAAASSARSTAATFAAVLRSGPTSLLPSS